MSSFRMPDIGGGGDGRMMPVMPMGGEEELRRALAMPTSQRAMQGQVVMPGQPELDPNELREFNRRQMAERRAMEARIRQMRAAAQRGANRPVSDAMIPGLAELQAQEAELRQRVAEGARLQRRAEGRELTPEQVEASRQRLAGQIPGAMASIAEQQQAQLSEIQASQMAREVEAGGRIAGQTGMPEGQAARVALGASPEQRRAAGLYDLGNMAEQDLRTEIARTPSVTDAQQRFLQATEPDFERMAQARAALDVTEDRAVADQMIRQRLAAAEQARQRSEATAAEMRATQPEQAAQMEQTAIDAQQEQLNQQLEDFRQLAPQERETRLAELERQELEARRAISRGEASEQDMQNLESLRIRRDALQFENDIEELESMLSGDGEGLAPGIEDRQGLANQFADFVNQLQEKNLGSDGTVASVVNGESVVGFNGARAVTNVRAMADKISEIENESDRRAYAETVYQTLQEQLGQDGQIVINTERPGSIGRLPSAFAGTTDTSRERYRAIATQINRIGKMAGAESPSVRIGNQLYDPTGLLRSGTVGFYEDITD